MTLLDALERIVAAMRATGLQSMDIASDDESLSITLATAIVPVAPPAVSNVKPVPVLSPGMGLFRPAAPSIPGRVAEGDILGFLEMDTLRRPIVAPTAGILGKEAPVDGTVLGYHDAIFLIGRD